jgi:cobyrinic acid a,c-diamide synthase
MTQQIEGSETVRKCPALVVSAPASGQGKTTATAALARWHTQQGRHVRVFKTGPDFLDPMILARASKQPVYQLDFWMCGEAHCRQLLWEAAGKADLILIEGVMGLHDGTSSTADLAIRLGLPVMAVIDGSAMAQTFGAIALGLATYRSDLQLAGVLANRVGSDTHSTMLKESLPEDMHWFGALPRDEVIALPERHLGLTQADEIDELEMRLDRAAASLDRIAPAMPQPASFLLPGALPAEQYIPAGALQGIRIGIARDSAFAFLYLANLEILQAMGAQLHFFSPLSESVLPNVDALYLPGGYPELHLQTLGSNTQMRDAIRAHHLAGKPIVAECGGMLALLDGLVHQDATRATMWGLLSGTAAMEKRLVNLGLHSVTLPEGTLRGHTFHYARMSSPAQPAFHTQALRHSGKAESVWRHGRLHASFLHMYFPSNPAAVAALFTPST